MPRKCGKHKAPAWAVARGAESTDTFATIYNSMLKSEAFKHLNNSAKIALIYCRNQATDRTATKCLFAHGKTDGAREYDYNEYFVFPAKHAEAYGLDRRNLFKAMDELIDSGFIEVEETNWHREKVNVYRFSGEWRNWPNQVVKKRIPRKRDGAENMEKNRPP